MSDPPDKSNDTVEPFDLEQRYSDWQVLGEGGMGKVFVAHDSMLDKKVAIKLLHSDVDSRAVVRFQQEAKVLSKLSHKYIVKIMDFHYSKSGQLFLVMEHVDGASLESVFNETGRLSPEEALRIAIQLSQALKHAHAQDIIHRDLKPANVMLDSERNAKILDFGIAKLVSSSEIFGTLTKAGQLIGSPLYMSPEQLRGEVASELSDVYGLGLLLFTMITGQPPFAGSNLMESLQQRLTESAPSLQTYVENPKFSAGLDKIVERALHPNPDQRLATMAEFEVELSALQAAAHPADSIGDTEVNPSVVIKPSTTKLIVGAFVALPLIAIFVFFVTSADKHSPPHEQPMKEADVLPVSVNSLKLKRGPLESIEPIPGFKTGDASADFWIPLNPTITKGDLRRLRESPVQNLNLANNGSVSGETLAQLPIEQLRALNLRNTKITDEDLQHVGKMKKLFWLNLSGTDITDNGIKYLQPLSNLRRLELRDCKGITNQAIPELLEIPALRNLHLDNSHVTREGIIQLRVRPFINLGLGELDINDDDIINGFPHLIHLEISGCKNITDKTLIHFAKKKKCVVIAEDCPNVTEQGIKAYIKTHRQPKPRRLNPNDVNDLGEGFFEEKEL